MSKKVIPIIQIILGIVACAYDVLLICLSPGTFWDIVTSFTHIWAFFGFLLIFPGVFKLIKNRSVWSYLKKKIRIIILICSGVICCIVFVNLLFILNPKIDDSESGNQKEYLILLGGGIDKNGVLPKQVMYRVEKATEYLQKNPEAICVVTGGTLKFLPYPEGPEIKRQLVLCGINEDRILVEEKALDTIQNLQYSCKLLTEYENCSSKEILESPVILVTNYFHLARAERIAKRLGYSNIRGIAVRNSIIKVPHSYVREILAYVKLNLYILLTGKPERI